MQRNCARVESKCMNKEGTEARMAVVPFTALILTITASRDQRSNHAIYRQGRK